MAARVHVAGICFAYITASKSIKTSREFLVRLFACRCVYLIVSFDQVHFSYKRKSAVNFCIEYYNAEIAFISASIKLVNNYNITLLVPKQKPLSISFLVTLKFSLNNVYIFMTVD